MKYIILSRQLAIGLLGLWGLFSISTAPVLADECEEVSSESCKCEKLTEALLDSCKDKSVTAKGPRVDMFEVPSYFMMADPTFSGGEGLQDYMTVGETPLIIHTNGEVQCPGDIEVTGTLQQTELEDDEGQAHNTWLLSVTEFKCL